MARRVGDAAGPAVPSTTHCKCSRKATLVAQNVVTRLTDDLDGHEAAETVQFSLDGTSYEIDLSEENADSFRDTLAVYIANGRKLTKSGHVVRRVSAGYDARAVRAWAQARGITVPVRGRIPNHVVQAFHEAGN